MAYYKVPPGHMKKGAGPPPWASHGKGPKHKWKGDWCRSNDLRQFGDASQIDSSYQGTCQRLAASSWNATSAAAGHRTRSEEPTVPS